MTVNLICSNLVRYIGSPLHSCVLQSQCFLWLGTLLMRIIAVIRSLERKRSWQAVSVVLVSRSLNHWHGYICVVQLLLDLVHFFD